MPVALYQATLPPHGIIDVRRVGESITPDVTREAGLAVCRLYFPGTSAVIRLAGDGDDLLGMLARHPKGSALLRSLEENAWFPKLATRLTPVLAAGRADGSDVITGVGTWGVNALHEPRLVEELREIAPSLEDGPRVEAFVGRGLTVYVEGATLMDIDGVLHGERGSALQRVLHDHTGFSTNARRTDFAFDLDVVRRGILSADNSEPGPESRWRIVR